MSRALALALVFAFGIVLAAPVLAPAHAATHTEVSGGLPTVPWQKIGQWILKNALTLLMLADEILRDLGGPDAPENEPPPLTVEAG